MDHLLMVSNTPMPGPTLQTVLGARGGLLPDDLHDPSDVIDHRIFPLAYIALFIIITGAGLFS
jgi:hypothetical protein